jgi:tetratricopeptide (TPR) repeat protein
MLRVEHAVMAVLFIVLFFAAFQRTLVWTDESTLWTDAVRKSPSKARPHNNLGRAYQDGEMIDRAAREFQEAIRISPRYAPAHSNMAGFYFKMGMWDRAEKELKLAIAHGPPYEDLHRRLGFVYMKKGLKEMAVDEFGKAVKLIPDSPERRRYIAAIYNNEAFLYSDMSDFTNALALHRIAVSVDADYANAHYGLALAYEGLGRRRESTIHWQEYLKLAPQDEPFREDAIRHLERLLESK